MGKQALKGLDTEHERQQLIDAFRRDHWCDHHDLGELVAIEPLHVAAYSEALQRDYAKPSFKQHLAPSVCCSTGW